MGQLLLNLTTFFTILFLLDTKWGITMVKSQESKLIINRENNHQLSPITIGLGSTSSSILVEKDEQQQQQQQVYYNPSSPSIIIPGENDAQNILHPYKILNTDNAENDAVVNEVKHKNDANNAQGENDNDNDDDLESSQTVWFHLNRPHWNSYHNVHRKPHYYYSASRPRSGYPHYTTYNHHRTSKRYYKG